MSNEFNPVPFLDEDRQYKEYRYRLLNDLGLSIKKQIDVNHLTRKEAAEIARITEPRLSDLLHGRLSKFSERSLFEIAFRLGVRINMYCKSNMLPTKKRTK